MKMIQIQIPRWHWFLASVFITAAVMSTLSSIVGMIDPAHPVSRQTDSFLFVTVMLMIVVPIAWATLRHPYTAPWGKERVYIVSVRARRERQQLEFRISRHPSGEWETLFKHNWHPRRPHWFGRKVLVTPLYNLADVAAVVDQTNAGIDAYKRQRAAEQSMRIQEAVAAEERFRSQLADAGRRAGIRIEK